MRHWRGLLAGWRICNREESGNGMQLIRQNEQMEEFARMDGAVLSGGLGSSVGFLGLKFKLYRKTDECFA